MQKYQKRTKQTLNAFKCWSLVLTHSFVSLAAVVYAVGISVVTQSPDVSVMEGETVSITCCWTRPFERFRVNWLKNQTVFRSETYANQSPESLKLEAKTCSSLNISNIRTEDSGTYICKVTVELPSLAEAKGNGTFITVREKTNDTDSTPSSGGLTKIKCHVFAVLQVQGIKPVKVLFFSSSWLIFITVFAALHHNVSKDELQRVSDRSLLILYLEQFQHIY
uniref:Ig-like domain-containing protein n=1 Tax=Neolamprologus brichardi TaxID=32507 RepID=A0A3Q4N4S9_NEOBR